MTKDREKHTISNCKPASIRRYLLKLLLLAFTFSALSLFGMDTNERKLLTPEEQSLLNAQLINEIEYSNAKLTKVDELLKRGANVNARGVNRAITEGWTVLMYAVYKGNEDIVKLLVGHGADVNGKDTTFKATVLMHAIEGRNVALVNLLLELGADIHTLDKRNSTVLMYALYEGNEAIINRLLELGVDVNARADDSYFGRGDTALLIAAKRGNVAALTKLVSRGADINAKNWLGQTALMCELQSGKNKEMIDRLLELKADIHACDDKKQTVIMYAAQAGDEEIFKKLIELKADVYAQDNGERLLQYAVEGGNLAIVNTLVDLNCSITPGLLGTAAYYGRIHLLDRLLELGQDIHACGTLDKTVLMYAVHGKSLAFVNRLIELGADIHAKTYYDGTVLMQAAEVGSEEIFNRLLDLGVDSTHKGAFDKTLLSCALKGRKLAIINKVMQLTNTFAVTAQEKEQIIAIIGRKLDKEFGPSDLKLVCTEHHQKYKANLQGYFYRDKSTKRTFLTIASIIGCTKSMKTILDTNPPCWYVQAQDYLGRTALMYAYNKGDKDCIRMLISSIRDAITREPEWAAVWKRSMNLKDKDGLTLLDYALDRGDLEFAREFIGLGCKCLARHLQKADSIGYKAIVALLSAAGKIVDHTGKSHSLFK